MKLIITILISLFLAMPLYAMGEDVNLNDPSLTPEQKLSMCLQKLDKTENKLKDVEVKCAKKEKDKFLFFFEADNTAYLGLGILLGAVIL